MVGAKLPGRVQYHCHLAMLGKTNLTDPDEQKILSTARWGLLDPMGNRHTI
jgi:hypothetical protein